MLDRHSRSSIAFKTRSDDKFAIAAEKAGIEIDKKIFMKIKSLFQNSKTDIAKLRGSNLKITIMQDASAYIPEPMLQLTGDSHGGATPTQDAVLKIVGDVQWPGEIAINALTFAEGRLTLNTGSIIEENILSGGKIFVYDVIKFFNNMITGATIETTKPLKAKRVLGDNYLQINKDLDYSFVDIVPTNSGPIRTKLIFKNSDLLKEGYAQTKIGYAIYKTSKIDDYLVVDSISVAKGALKDAIEKFVATNCRHTPSKWSDAEAGYALIQAYLNKKPL
jgi:hypothetical protein